MQLVLETKHYSLKKNYCCLHNYKKENSISTHFIFNIHSIQCLSINCAPSCYISLRPYFKVFSLVNVNSLQLCRIYGLLNLCSSFCSPSLPNCGSRSTSFAPAVCHPHLYSTQSFFQNEIPEINAIKSPIKSAKLCIHCILDFARVISSSQ